MMHEHFSFLVLGLTSFLSLLNPLAATPIFATMTQYSSREGKLSIARKTALTTALTLIAFSLLGEFIFSFFGVTIHGFRIAGGVLFFGMGITMLQGRELDFKGESMRPGEQEIGVTPLGIPIICGPGAITNAMVLTGDANTLGLRLILLASVLLSSLVVFLVLLGSGPILRKMGENGIGVAKRIMGLIVTVIAVEMIYAGIRPLAISLLREALK